MTHAIDSTAHDELDLPAPDDYQADAAADRARKVAALHALADWFAAHPDVPMPRKVICQSHLHSGPGAQLDQRLDAIAAFAVAHPTAVRKQHNKTVWANLVIVQTAAMQVEYDLVTSLDVPL